MDDVDSRPLGTPEESHSPSISEPAEAGPAPQVASQVKSVEARSVARGFLIAAALIALADTMVVPWLKHELPNALVVTALALALAGIAVDLAAGARSSVSSRSLVLERALTSDGWCAFAVGILFLAFYAATISPPTPYTEPVRQAYAFLHWRTWVDAPSYMEHVTWHGKSYLLHPPLAALITLPAVAVWGLATNQTADLGRRRGGLARPGVAAAEQDRSWSRSARMAHALLRRRHDILVRGYSWQLVGLRRTRLDTVHLGRARRDLRRGTAVDGWFVGRARRASSL